jgi:hypothetical protein
VSYTLQNFRDYVWAHLDVDDQDIGPALVDAWCREATEAIARHRSRWPFFQQDWLLTLAPDQANYEFTVFDPPLDEMSAITAYNRSLTYIGPADADFFAGAGATSSTPLYYSWWGDTLSVYPTPVETETLTVRGWRMVADWVAGGAGAVADLPTEFDEVIRNRLLGEAYAQQEDPDLGQFYFSKAQALLVSISSRLGVTPTPQPLILGGGGNRLW